MNIRHISLGLAFVGAVVAQAQVVSNPDPAYTLLMQTDGLVSKIASKGAMDFFGTVRGIGWDNGNFASQFGSLSTLASARSQYNLVKYTGPTQAVGSRIQVGIHGFCANRTVLLSTASVYVSIYEHNASVGVGQIPIGAPVVRGIKVNLQASLTEPQGSLFFSASSLKTKLAKALTNGQSYVMVVAPSKTVGGTDATNFALLMTQDVNAAGTSIAGLPVADRNLFKSEWSQLTNNADAGGAFGLFNADSRMVAFRLYGGTPVNLIPTGDPIDKRTGKGVGTSTGN